MRLSPKEALEYLDHCGFTMSDRTLRREKAKLQNEKFERMQHIALYFQDQHLERIDKCELVEKLMWENYFAEKDPTKRVSILNSIINMQPYLSAYYDATRYVLKNRVKTDTDLRKTPRPYVSIDVRSQREEEIKKEAEDRRFTMIREREGETIRKNNESIDRTMPKAIEGFEHVQATNDVLPKEDLLPIGDEEELTE